MVKSFRKYHKWIGLFFSFFILMFAFSGIVLNHRKVFSFCDVPRIVMPKPYQYSNWNNGAISGTTKLAPNKVLMYGNSGVWIADSLMRNINSFTTGLPRGIDNKTFRAVTKTTDGAVFAVSTHRFYFLDSLNMQWVDISNRIAHSNDVYNDVYSRGNKLYVVMRSHIYESALPYEYFERIDLPKPATFSNKVSLFRTMWVLHSGELFGIGGKLVVDFLGIILIILTITGLVLTFWKKPIKKYKKNKRLKKTWLVSLNWHNKLGSTLLLLFIVLGVSGWFLRPPLLIPIVRTKINPVPFSTLDSKNPWHNKIRNLRYDEKTGKWLLYSSDGFYQFSNFSQIPQKVKNSPPVSVMGINAWETTSDSTFIIGSFSGAFEWDYQSGAVYDAITKAPYVPYRGRPRKFSSNSSPTSGYSSDFSFGDIAFDYNKGAYPFEKEVSVPLMPQEIVETGRISLWHFSLELHVGRLYKGFLFAFAPFFIFLSGLLFLFILISGYVVYRKRYRKRHRKNKK